ncbi:hypothetical protein FHP25_03970 [Vineibacter terrae]|uniref:Uncharacterized protein n=1 Tax=Vineibacter terrae TaxID=2586908 RepID=A0A5C8PU05_9HYPH|nr:hypothetical protein [Vineibacter terrae]TXL81696.1 hypothetical protein FHP25_03970 [Vineibacter terrae]
MKQSLDVRCAPLRIAPAAGRDGLLSISRRLLLTALPLGLAACQNRGGPEKLSPQAARLVGWVRDSGRDSVLDPRAPRIMGMDNGQRDIPVKQLAENTPNGRHTLSLTVLRGRQELIFHRREGDYLYFHLASANLVRQASATYPRQGAPGRMIESLASTDYPAQASYWLEQAERRAV